MFGVIITYKVVVASTGAPANSVEGNLTPYTKHRLKKMLLINAYEVFTYNYICLQRLQFHFALQLCSAGSGSRKEGENVLFMAKSAFLKWIFSGALDRNLFIQRKSIGQLQQTQQDPYTQY